MPYTYAYPRPALTADVIVIARGHTPQVLLIRRANEPFKGQWAFPGGFMDMDETVTQCAIRELKEETGLEIETMIQIGTYSRVDRDPRGRTVTVAHLAVLDQPEPVIGMDDAERAKWWNIHELPPLAFDHREIMDEAWKLFCRTTDHGAGDNGPRCK